VEKGPLLITPLGFSGPVIFDCLPGGSRELAAGGYRFGIQVNWDTGLFRAAGPGSGCRELRQEGGSRQVGSGNPFWPASAVVGLLAWRRQISPEGRPPGRFAGPKAMPPA